MLVTRRISCQDFYYKLKAVPQDFLLKDALLCNFIEITLPHGCSPVNLLKVFRIFFLSERLRGTAPDKLIVTVEKKKKAWNTINETNSLVIVCLHDKLILGHKLRMLVYYQCRFC